jgi:hypothetical protein
MVNGRINERNTDTQEMSKDQSVDLDQPTPKPEYINV